MEMIIELDMVSKYLPMKFYHAKEKKKGRRRFSVTKLSAYLVRKLAFEYIEFAHQLETA